MDYEFKGIASYKEHAMIDFKIPAPGDPAPGFCLRDTSGKDLRLEDCRGKWVVLYFYPKDDTPGCTTEACASPRSREKASRRGSTRCTRAARTPARPRMVRASSPSSARSRFTSCWKGVVVRDSPRSKIS